ncbi:MAG: hypothetical protein KTR31_16745 [Myxococcales bacterium]|nr:hypothetical protein [Myxococcales bacterium]
MRWLWVILGTGCLNGGQLPTTSSPTSPPTEPCDAPVEGWTLDADGDGYGDPMQPSCPDDPRAVRLSGDCDDTDAAVHPDRTEICAIGDARDDDCDDATADPVASVGDQPFADVALAMKAADGGGEVVVCDGQTLRLDPVPVGGSLAVRSASGQPGGVTLRAKGGALFELQGQTSSLTLQGLTITGGSAPVGGAVVGGVQGTVRDVDLYGEVALIDVVAQGNDATYGGVVAADRITVEGGEASSNNAVLDGGAFYGNTVTVRGSQLSANRAQRGGAVHVFGGASFTASTFAENFASSWGGAIYASNPSEDLNLRLDVSKSVFVANKAWQGGGAVFASRVAVLEATGAQFDRNVALDDVLGDVGEGGAIYLLTFKKVKGSDLLGGTYDDNEAWFGGAVYVGCDEDDVFVLNGLTAQRNDAQFGGAVYLGGGCTTTLRAPTLSDNTADQLGGALFVASGTNVRVEEGVLVDNTAVLGGAIYLRYNTDTTLQDTALLRNEATNPISGAVHAYDGPGTFALRGAQIDLGLDPDDNEAWDVAMGPQDLGAVAGAWAFEAGFLATLSCTHAGCTGS